MVEWVVMGRGVSPQHWREEASRLRFHASAWVNVVSADTVDRPMVRCGCLQSGAHSACIQALSHLMELMTLSETLASDVRRTDDDE